MLLQSRLLAREPGQNIGLFLCAAFAAKGPFAIAQKPFLDFLPAPVTARVH